MVDRESQQPHEGDDSPFFDTPGRTEEVLRRRRYEQIGQARSLLDSAFELDVTMPSGKHTKKYVSLAGGTDRYPFPHFRIKLKPKNRVQSTIAVAVLRYPTLGLPDSNKVNLHDDGTVYVAWETSDGEEEAFVLDSDAFSCLDLDTAFGAQNDHGGWPSTAARTHADEIKQFTLQSLLEDFEPDLQTNDAELSA